MGAIQEKRKGKIKNVMEKMEIKHIKGREIMAGAGRQVRDLRGHDMSRE